MTRTSDGHISFLKPGSNEWKALDNDSYIYWRDCKADNVLKDAGAPRLPPETLSDSEKKELKDNQVYFHELLLKSLQFPNLSFFAGSGTSLGDVGGPSMWDLWRCAMWEDPTLTEEGRIKAEAQKFVKK